MISAEVVATDPAKTKAVSEWPVPTSVKEVRPFLGLAGYYMRFVRNYVFIAAPLHKLTKKDNAFETLRFALTLPPVLTMPLDIGNFFWIPMPPTGQLVLYSHKFKMAKSE